MSEQHRPEPDQDDSERQGVPVTVTSDGERVVVVTPDGMGVAEHDDPPADEARERPTNPADLVEQPAKVMRIGSMVKQLLDEVRSAPLDETGRARLAEIHQRSIAELGGRPGPRAASRSSSGSPCRSRDDSRPPTPSCGSPRPSSSGWLEGLFHGIQTALVAQQMAAQAQLQQMRQLPPGTSHQGMPSQGAPGMPQPPRRRASRVTPRAPASTSDHQLSRPVREPSPSQHIGSAC